MPQSSVAETITQGPPRRLLDGKKRVLTSAMLVALGLWIRLGVSDAPAFKELKDSGNVAKTPLHDALTKFPRLLLVTSGLHLAQNSVFYLITVYTLSYLADNRDDSTAGVTAVMIASAIGLFTEPLWGGSDKVARKRVRIGGIIGMNLAHDAIYGPQAAWFAEQFPIEIRYSGVNMGCQLGTVIGAAIMPTVAALLCVVGRHSSSAATRRRPPLAVADLRLPHAAVPALTHRGTGGEGPRW